MVIIKTTYVSTNIKDFYEKHKSLVKNLKNELLSILVIFFVGLSSFGLGILFERSSGVKTISDSEAPSLGVLNSVLPTENSSQKALSLDATTETSTEGGEVVVSKNGTKYHFPWCGGAKQISEKNKITFKSIEEAKKAGYTPASNCKGLK
ncbi:MAG: hypothetical protein QG585_170 [Patescibacteria group bacterium]|nr:hypothetical protein [Patescibacteria group bacterium]